MRALTVLMMMIAAAATAPCAAGALTLDSCLRLALENNAAVKQAAYGKMKAAETRKEAFTKYFPEISAQGVAFRANTGMAEIGLLDILTISFLKKGHLGGIQFVQPLFMGGQIVNGNRLAAVGEAVAELQQRQTRRDVALTVEKYYWQIAALKARQKTLASATRTVDSLLVTVQAALDAGVTTLNDVLEVKLKRSGLTADSVELANGLALCGMVLAQYIGMGTAGVETADETFERAPGMPLDRWRQPGEAVLEMPQYGMLSQAVEAARLERRIAVGKYLPSVVGGGGYFHQSMLGASHGFWAGAIGVSIPLSGWWGGSHDIRKKKIAEEEARLRLEDDAQRLSISIAAAWDDLTAAQRKAALAAESIGQARENLRIYDAFYEAGTCTITDLLGAQTLQREAEDRLTEACAAYRVSLAAYLLATSQREP